MLEPYPEEIMKSVEEVERTRPERIKANLEKLRLPLDKREEVLRKYHPDYKEENFSTLMIGPSKGDKAPNEVVKLLESYPLVEPDDIDFTDIDYDVDVLIIGGGGAGTVAAIWACEQGVSPNQIFIVTKLRYGDSNSKMAQGGTQAALLEDDSPLLHYLDTMGGGHFVNKPELVEALTRDAPSIIEWHRQLGVMYDRYEDGTMAANPAGGLCRRRMHCCEDYTGLEQMRVIMDRAINLGIPVLEFTPCIELLSDGKGKIGGALLWNLETNQYYVVRAKTTILATGGFGRLHIQGFPTTNHYGATADGLIMAYRAGAKLRDMDSVQYHPTGGIYPEPVLGLLITEKVRSLGGQPVNRDGKLFVHPLETRDVEASMFIRECEMGKGIETPTGTRGIWLDTPIIDMIKGEGTFKKNFPAMMRMYLRHGIDPTKYPILTYPALHYQNGGVEINTQTETSVEGLLAAGEVEGGVHGKNRLMGNSTLDYNVFGRRAGIRAAERAKKVSKPGKLNMDHARKYIRELEALGVKRDRRAPMILPDYRGERALSRSLSFGV